MNDVEERPSLIVECPHCHVRVIAKTDNTCPNCHEDMADMTGVDPIRVPLILFEMEELPTYCYSCNRFTDQYVRASSDGESGIETLIFGDRRPEDTSNVIVFLPVCEACAEKEIELIEADYDHQTMKIIVHQGFRDRVLQYRENPPPPLDENQDEDL